jgi:serpin B
MIDPLEVMYLINTVYFRGLWSSPFNRYPTSKGPFTTGEGQSKQISLMHQEQGFPYYQGPDFQAISLPYGAGRFSMVAILPRRGLSLQTFARRLTADTWRDWTSHLRYTMIDLAFPRFTLRNQFSLKPALSSLGMSRAFGPHANFSGLCTSMFCRISQVLQKTYLNVYEKGTTAAAVTLVAIATTSLGAPPPKMIVDHPFLLVIRDKLTGAILFLGAISDPS